MIEFLDELVSGAWTAAWPLIRDDLGLTYVEVGILLSLPYIFGSILEPALGLLGDAWNRRALVRAGGVGFVAALVLVAVSEQFAPLLLSLMLINPASGAFVGLAQAALMDGDAERHEHNMARWALAGSLGMLAGPLVLSAITLSGFGWRAAFWAFTVLSAMVLAAAWRMPTTSAVASGHRIGTALLVAAADAWRALRRRDVLRWLTLLEFSNLMIDVLYGFLALYFVDVAGASGARAALAIVVWTGVGLVGDALLIPLLRRVEGTRYLRASAWTVLVLFPVFLLLHDGIAKLIVLGALGLLNSGWYAILKGQLYSALPGRGATVMALSSLFGTAGGMLPLIIGVVAQHFGLAPAMWLLLAGPLALLAGIPRTWRLAKSRH